MLTELTTEGGDPVTEVREMPRTGTAEASSATDHVDTAGLWRAWRRPTGQGALRCAAERFTAHDIAALVERTRDAAGTRAT